MAQFNGAAQILKKVITLLKKVTKKLLLAPAFEWPNYGRSEAADNQKRFFQSAPRRPFSVPVTRKFDIGVISTDMIDLWPLPRQAF